MFDLEEQVREYVRFLDQQTQRVAAGAAVERASGTPRSTWLRRPAFAFGAAILVVAVVGMVVLLEPFGGDEVTLIEEPATASTTTVPVSTTAASETAVVPPTNTTTVPTVEEPTISWVRIESDAFAGEGHISINDVVEGGPGLVAVGGADFRDNVWVCRGQPPAADCLPVQGPQAAVWHSTDGTTWSRVPHDEAVFGDAMIRAIVAGGPGLVAVGHAGNFAGDSAAAVWVSENGMDWSRVPHDEEVFGGTFPDMWDVAVGGPGLVAVGWEHNTRLDTRAAVWTSSDGLTWDRVLHDETPFAMEQGMWALTSGDRGLVAVGSDWSEIGPAQPAAVWTSPDGLTWTRAPEQEQLESGHPEGLGVYSDMAMMNDVAATEAGYVAVGRVRWCYIPCYERASAWTSVDGKVWQRSQVENVVGVYFPDMAGVTALGDVLIGVGRGWDPWDHGPAVVWASIDGGQTWARQPHSGTMFGKLAEGPVAMWTVTEYDSRLVAAGNWGPDAAVWIGTIDE